MRCGVAIHMRIDMLIHIAVLTFANGEYNNLGLDLEKEGAAAAGNTNTPHQLRHRNICNGK